MQLMNKFFLTFLLLFIVPILYGDATDYPTHFQYEINEKISSLSPTNTISFSDVKKWDTLIQNYLKENDEVGTERFFAYLYTAMRDTIFLTYQTKGYFAGSLDPISLKITQLFYPHFQSPQEYESDPYSEALAQVVFAPYQERFQEESKAIKKEKGSALKTTKLFFWLLKKPIYPPAPVELQSKEGLARQLSLLKKFCEHLTKEDQEQALFWEGDLYPGSGDWRLIANQYMEKHNVEFAKQVLVRSHFAMALADGLIDTLISKYHFNFPRPPLKDPSLKPTINLPKTPSYPSHHATEGFLAKTILTYYFPLDEDYFLELANQSARSRICAKVHYPLDREAGMKLGDDIGKAFIERMDIEPIDFKK